MNEKDKRRERNKRYYENKKTKDTIKIDRIVPNNFIDFELVGEAKAAAIEIMDSYKSKPDYLHSLLEYLEVLYHDWYHQELKRLKNSANSTLSV